MSNAIHRLVSLKSFSACLFATVGLLLSPMSANSASPGTVDASIAVDDATPVWPDIRSDYPRWHLPRGATLRLGKGTIGQSDRAIAISPDGKLVAVASTLGVWLYTVEDLSNFTLLPSDIAHSVAFSPDGATLAWGSAKGPGTDNGEIVLWDVATGTQTGTIGTGGWIKYLSFSPDGKTIAFGSSSEWIELWDVAAGSNFATFDGISSLGTSVAFSPDGKTIASGREDGTIKVWDMETRANIATLEGHRREVLSVDFAPDGKILASASADGKVKLWDVPSRTISSTIQKDAFGVYAVAFSPTGSTFATGAYNGLVRIWRTATLRNFATFDRHNSKVISISFLPDGETLVTASESGDVFLWDLASGNVTAITGHLGPVWGLAFSQDGTTLASRTLSINGYVNIWDAASGLMKATLSRHNSAVQSISMSPDGTKLVSASIDRTVRLWDLVTHSPVKTFRHDFRVQSLSFSPDGTIIALGDFDGNVNLWHVKTAKRIERLTGFGDRVTALLFSPDGATLAAGYDGGQVRLWEVITGTTILELDGHAERILSMAFSLNGATMATAPYRGILKVWDLASGSATAPLQAKTNATAAFSPDRTMFATSGGGLVRLFDMSTGDIIATLEGHNDAITSVLFSPDGRTLASGSYDGAILMWDLQLIQSRSHLLMEVSGIEQRGPAGTVLAQPFVVSVLDQNGEPYAGATVTFVVTAGGGTLSITTATTNASGHAATTLTLGSQPGTNTVVATVAGLDPVAFTAIALSNAGLLMEVSGIEQRGPAGTVLAQPFVVSVLDQNGEPSAGATVIFVVTAGGGTLSVTTATTDASGHAATTLTLGNQPGTNTVVAIVAGLDPVVFTAIALSNTDFDGNGKVDFGDFVLFAGKFGLNQGDAGYEARYDLDGNDAIGFSDFLIFARHFGRN